MNCDNREKKGNRTEHEKSAGIISLWSWATKRGSLYCFPFKEIGKSFSYRFLELPGLSRPPGIQYSPATPKITGELCERINTRINSDHPLFSNFKLADNQLHSQLVRLPIYLSLVDEFYCITEILPHRDWPRADQFRAVKDLPYSWSWKILSNFERIFKYHF